MEMSLKFPLNGLHSYDSFMAYDNKSFLFWVKVSPFIAPNFF